MVQSLRDRFVGSVQLALVVLLASVAMVLLIACANVANLVLVRGRARQSDMAIRAALGAGRRGLVSYLLAENLLLAAAAACSASCFAAWGIDMLKSIAPSNLPRLDDIGFDVPTFAFALAVVTLTALLFGVGPSLQLSRLPLAGRAWAARNHRAFRRALDAFGAARRRSGAVGRPASRRRACCSEA